MYRRPFPTNPKFAEAATAIRESKNGEYFVEYPLNPCVLNSMMKDCGVPTNDDTGSLAGT